MTKPLLSIIIPTFNAAASIEIALDSIFGQDFQDYEVIIIDACSSDGTLAIIQAQTRQNRQVSYISEKDAGVYDAMNKGIRHAKGEWLYFLGADDKLFNNNILREIFQHQEINNFNVVYGNVQIVGDTSWAQDGAVYDGEFSLPKLLLKNICHQCIFYRKQFIDSIGLYNTDYVLCADWDYNLRSWAATKFLYIDSIVAYFQAGGESTKTGNDINFSKIFLQNVVRYFKLSPFHPLINNSSFPYYHDVLLMQKRKNLFRYFFSKVRAKFG